MPERGAAAAAEQGLSSWMLHVEIYGSDLTRLQRHKDFYSKVLVRLGRRLKADLKL